MSPRSTEAIFDGSMVRLGLSAALTEYPPPPSTTSAIAAQTMRRRFLPFFPFPKPLPLLDIPDPRYIRLAATSDTQPCGKSSLVCSIRRWRGLLVRLVRSAPTLFDGIGGSTYDAAHRSY